ncbi:SDR family NAD(P)-dependent oxidoreductase [Streptomyces sp. NBC_01283]|uniref:SDR family NAD(P)-dependent oxidoreductase n=1 Tax=Streptomyces sp. NBC_01283 TaxID=2903812 RepID=UPI00352DA178|nr:SDR family NAD(P)-dependent oxidoreductase [Streptomyces sp. NBC_01283]WSL21359.1 SDR family NAD(P)-dependent oxidoreductase [Streptomyces sp. NBC_01283]
MSGRDARSLVDHFRTVLGEHSQEQIFRFLVDGEGEPQALGNAELDLRARTIAAALQERFPAGERALIMCPAGLDYVTSFFACLYADVVAVPVYPPDPAFPMRTLPRLTAIVEDAEPAVVLAPAATIALVDRFAEHAPALRNIVWIAVDDIDTAAADGWRAPGTERDDLAFLQYTSGSTSSPKGVMVSHGNLMHNISEMNRQFFGNDPDQHMVSWLPPFHDLGLIMGLLTPAYGGYPVTFMSPYSFLKRPLRWLRAISDVRATASPAPNFAYDLAVAKITEQDRQTLDLSSWRVALNGAEPVRKQTMDRFSRTFAECGYRPTTHAPSYGLAEATLVVSTGDPAAEPVHRDLRTEALLAGVAETAGPGEAARNLPSCGISFQDQQVAVVDPQTHAALPAGRVGELWVAGPSVARGYWRRPQATEETFRAHLDTGEGPFLRTGDLGFADGDQIYVTGRIKDVVIVAGRNHYPQDIERTVESVDPGLREGCGVAGAREIDGEERLIVVQEYRGSRSPEDRARVIDAIRTEVAHEHGLQPFIVALTRTGTVPKTSSGKLQRAACLDALLAGTAEPLALWRADEAKAGRVPEEAPGASKDVTERPAPNAREIEQWLRQSLAAATGRQVATIDPDVPFAGYGLRSVELVSIVGELEQHLGVPLQPGIVWEHPTAAKLAAHLAGSAADSPAPSLAEPATTLTAPVPAAAPAGAAGQGADEPIAIIGIGCRFPGGVDGPDSFWQLLTEGRDAVTEVPADRWSTEEFTDADPAAPGRTTSRWGGFVEGVDQFDSGFFGISQQEAARMDPQQRLLAEVSFEALENAGVPTASLSGTQTGVFIGISTFDYATGQLNDLDAIDAYTGTGSALSIAANRLSYLLDLRGPSMAVDSACSSSLVAVLQACTSLSRGDCDLAVAGGVNLVLSPAFAINFSKAGVMSAEGRCKPFDASADGYVRSEGAGVVILKPLSRALADGDPVHAVIRGGAVNQDGASNGLMAPNPKAQQAVVRAAHARAGVRAADIAYVEAHGTGTILGDPIEAKALGGVLGDGRAADRPCLIGSVKSNLGHMEAAAGIGGLIKTALMVRHRMVPPTLHYRAPNPHIPFDELPVRVADTLQPWPATAAPALAGVSSFGFGGTNAHLVVEEPPPAAAPAHSPSEGAALLTVSARDEQALRDLAARYADKLTGATPVRDVTAAAAVRRTHHEHRLACVGADAPELRTALAAFGRGESVTGLSTGVRRAGQQSKPVFVFSGQGPRWWPLAAELLTGDLAAEQAFSAVLERADTLLRRHTDWSLLDQLAADPARSRLLDTAVGQPALTAVQIALAALWRSWGIEPAAVVGHSVGEIAAAHVAGAISLEDALLIALHRGTALHAATGKGRMAVAGVSLDEARTLLAERAPGPVWIAAANSPGSTVFSGENDALETFAKSLADDGLYCKVLESVEFASHCPLMEPVASELWRVLAPLRPRPTAIPMISTGTGEIVPGDRLDAEYWASNLTRPVLFDTAVTALADTGHNVFVEASPHPMLTDAVTERLASYDDGVAVSSLRRDQPGRATVLGELGRLYTAGHQIDWRRVHGPAGPMTDLPAYPWQRTRSWRELRPAGRSAHRGHPALRERTVSALSPHAVHWSAPVDLAEFPYLTDHQVGGSPVLPAALMLDAALGAARDHLDDGAVLHDVAFTRLSVVPEQADGSTLQLTLVPATADTATVRLFTRSGAGEDWTEAARAGVRRTAPVATAEPLAPVRTRCATSVPSDEHYAALRHAGLAYGPAFQGIEELWQGRAEAVARLRERSALTTDRGKHPVHPVVLDSALQVLSAALDAQDQPLDATYVPVAVGGFTLVGDQVAPRWAHAAVTAPQPGADTITGARVVLYDAEGAAVGEITDVTLQRLDRTETADPRDEALLDLVWRSTPAPAPALQQPPGSWLLFVDQARTTAGLADALRAHGATCRTVTTGPAYRKVGPDHYEIDPGSREDIAALLADLTASGTGPDGIVHGWSLDIGLPEEGDGRPPASAAGDAGLPVLRLVQELALAGQDPAPRLVLLTRGAQHAADGDELNVGQAPLWGLARVIGLEHTELRSSVIDLDPARPAEEGALLLAEVLGSGDNDQVALRGAVRLTPALQPWAPTDDPGQGPRPAWNFDAARDGNHHLLAARPGSLTSLRPTWWHRTPPGPGQVEVEVTAAGLNFSDVLKALGSYPGAEGVVPLGAECAGRVTAVGEGVSAPQVGDRVIAAGPGSMAAFITLDAQLVAPAPPALDDEQAAAVPIAFLTAVHGLERLARLGEGESVLVHSATGGVGLAALQVARRRGARVFATAGTPAKRDLLRGLGVEHVMDSRTLDFAEEIRALTGGRGVDVVLNSSSGEALVRSLDLVAPGGRFVEIGKRDIYDNSHIGLEFFKGNRAFMAVDLEHTIREEPERVAGLFADVVEGFDRGEFTALPITTHPFADAPAAFTAMAKARHTGKLVLLPAANESVTTAVGAAPVRPSGTYLITGGLGALGLETARYLVGQGARHVVLVGRNAPGPHAEAVLAELRTRAEVVVTAADVSRRGAVDDLLARLDGSLPPLAGVVHAAGILDDGLLTGLAPERFRSVAGPKSAAAWHLHQATSDRDLDFFVLYSSAAAVLGSASQGNYAAASAFVDALAHHRRSLGLPALSIDWGPWAQIGLAAHPDRGGSLAARGIESISPDQGIAALDRLLSSSAAQVCVLPLDHERVRGHHGGGLLRTLVDDGGQDTQGAAGPQDEIRRLMLAVEPGRRRRAVLTEHGRAVAARVIGADPARIDTSAPITGMGFDSLLSLELRKSLESSLGIQLPSTVTWRFPTIDALVPYLADRMGIQLESHQELGGDRADPPAVPAGPVPASSATENAHGIAADESVDLDSMSAAELGALLMAKTTQIDEGAQR